MSFAALRSAKFEPTDVQKEIIRGWHGQFAGNLSEYAATGNYQQQAFNPSDPRGLMTTEHTTRKCRLCRGNRWFYAIWQGHGNIVTRQKCTHCQGTGEVFG